MVDYYRLPEESYEEQEFYLIDMDNKDFMYKVLFDRVSEGKGPVRRVQEEDIGRKNKISENDLPQALREALKNKHSSHFGHLF